MTITFPPLSSVSNISVITQLVENFSRIPQEILFRIFEYIVGRLTVKNLIHEHFANSFEKKKNLLSMHEAAQELPDRTFNIDWHIIRSFAVCDCCFFKDSHSQ